MKPSAHLILLRSCEHKANGIEIECLDGQRHTASKTYFKYDIAKALNQNTVRVDAFRIKEALQNSPQWLSIYFPEASIAILPKYSTELEISGQEKSKYRIFYHNNKGIFYETREHDNMYTDSNQLDETWY